MRTGTDAARAEAAADQGPGKRHRHGIQAGQDLDRLPGDRLHSRDHRSGWPEEEKAPNELLKVVRIILPEEDKGKYTHRNYLGGIVKLGLKREMVGDILVDEQGADIIVINDFATILKEQLFTLTRFANSKIEIIDIQNLKKLKIQKEEIKIIVASLRLDNIVSDLARTSRNKAVEIIKQERVFINGQNEIKPSKQLKINDIITIRGKGRFIIKEIAGTTRSGRPILTIEKYV